MNVLHASLFSLSFAMNRILTLTIMLFASWTLHAQKATDYVDPRIGSEGLGRTYIGPCLPFGMAKPSPDCTTSPNAGWLPLPTEVTGFAQTHVSGTGGGSKYGNVLIQPGVFPQHRTEETISLGYYRTTYTETGITTEITATQHTSVYRITYPKGSPTTLRFDLSFFLGRNPVPKTREAQQFEDAGIHLNNDGTICGHQTISGGWNNGAPYTVFFYAKTDVHPTLLNEDKSGQGPILDLQFDADTLQLRIAISFLGIDEARIHLEQETQDLSFEILQQRCVAEWQHLLEVFTLHPQTPKNQKRMFYTALYHTCLMPVEREDNTYDDYYAIWDTYRTSTPLLTLIDPQRATDMVRSLLTIYQREGYMPDARSGNSNGRTQGGSNAEIVLADALAKGLPLDYELALEAMLKDATVPPADDEAEGRGGLMEYNTLGYIPYGIPRAGNRTVEYSFCDWAIAQVAKHLGKNKLCRKYLTQSLRWRNLWRGNYEHGGARGFIMPRDAQGQWLDHLSFGHSRLQALTFRYTPDTSYEGPWYCKWWDCFMYEASSWEYSFSIPHDIPSLIDSCGGPMAFEARLDTFFARNYYNVANEPSFLTPCLYHWIDKPERSGKRIRDIISLHFNDTPNGLPGNDDSGAMSSWLAFHLLGLYPLAGTDTYLIHSPLVSQSQFRALSIVADSTIKCPLLNNTPLPSWRISHRQLLKGGILRIPSLEAAPTLPRRSGKDLISSPDMQAKWTCFLHGQTRRFEIDFEEHGDSLTLHWTIVRNLKRWFGSYTMSPMALESATHLSYEQPLDGNCLILPDQELFLLFPRQALRQLRVQGQCTFCSTRFRVLDHSDGIYHLLDIDEGAELWVNDNLHLPLILEMQNNPVEIDWKITKK